MAIELVQALCQCRCQIAGVVQCVEGSCPGGRAEFIGDLLRTIGVVEVVVDQVRSALSDLARGTARMP